jgi:hypothetical protein
VLGHFEAPEERDVAMKRILFPAMLAVAMLAMTPRPEACGDKFVAGVGRGPSFRGVYAAVYPAHVVIVSGPTTSKSSGIHDPKFKATLERAGHTVSVVSATSLGHGPATGTDLVIADYAELASLPAGLVGGEVLVLPVLDKASKAEKASCGQRYTCELNASDRVETYLKAIDASMKVRVNAQKVLAQNQQKH